MLAAWRKALAETLDGMSEGARAGVKRHLQDAATSAVISLASIFTTGLVALAKSESEQRPWQTLWIALPASLLLWLLLQSPAGRLVERPRGWILVTLIALGALTSAATFTRLFDWHRPDIETRSDPFRLLRHPEFGDWRYWWFSAPQRQDPRIVLVTVPRRVDAATGADDVPFGRADVVSVLDAALANGATGVALDLRFRDSTDVDVLLRDALQRVHARGPLIAGMDLVGGGANHKLVRVPVAPGLASALPDSCLGHVVALLGADGVVRSIPGFAGDHPLRPSIALRIASKLEGLPIEKLKLPGDGEIRFTRPAHDFAEVPSDSLLLGAPRWRGLLRDQFVIVGEGSARELRATPWGARLGVQVQAWAVNSILLGRLVHRDQWWVGAVVVWAALYWLASLAQAGRTLPTIAWWAGGIAASCLAFSAAAMRASLIWVDITYIAPALVVFLAILAIGPRRHVRQPPAAREP